MSNHSSRILVAKDLKRIPATPPARRTRHVAQHFLLQIGFIAPYISVSGADSQNQHFHPVYPLKKLSDSGLFSVILSVALRPPAFRWYLLLRSPDFPPPWIISMAAIALLSLKFMR